MFTLVNGVLCCCSSNWSWLRHTLKLKTSSASVLNFKMGWRKHSCAEFVHSIWKQWLCLIPLSDTDHPSGWMMCWFWVGCTVLSTYFLWTRFEPVPADEWEAALPDAQIVNQHVVKWVESPPTLTKSMRINEQLMNRQMNSTGPRARSQHEKHYIKIRRSQLVRTSDKESPKIPLPFLSTALLNGSPWW